MSVRPWQGAGMSEWFSTLPATLALALTLSPSTHYPVAEVAADNF
jgi:hypothetical protein